MKWDTNENKIEMQITDVLSSSSWNQRLHPPVVCHNPCCFHGQSSCARPEPPSSRCSSLSKLHSALAQSQFDLRVFSLCLRLASSSITALVRSHRPCSHRTGIFLSLRGHSSPCHFGTSLLLLQLIGLGSRRLCTERACASNRLRSGQPMRSYPA